MSMSHHGDSEVMKRFLDQMHGTSRREYPAGRMGHEDDGALSSMRWLRIVSTLVEADKWYRENIGDGKVD